MLFEPRCFHSGQRTLAVPLRAQMRKQQGMKLNEQSAVEPHRGAQDLECEKEMERERFQEKKRQKEEYMRKLDQTPTSLVQPCGASKQLPLDVDEGVNRSWERIKIAGNADKRGISAVQRQAGQGLGRICEAGAVTHWEEMKKRLGLKAPSRELEIP